MNPRHIVLKTETRCIKINHLYFTNMLQLRLQQKTKTYNKQKMQFKFLSTYYKKSFTLYGSTVINKFNIFSFKCNYVGNYFNMSCYMKTFIQL